MNTEWIDNRLSSWQAQEQERQCRFDLDDKFKALAPSFCDELITTAAEYVQEYNLRFQSYPSCCCTFHRLQKGFEIIAQQPYRKISVLVSNHSYTVLSFILTTIKERDRSIVDKSMSIEIDPDYDSGKPAFKFKEQRFTSVDYFLTQVLLGHIFCGS